MMRGDGSSMAVRLGVARRNAKFACPGVVAEILVEGAILLAGEQDMVDRIDEVCAFLAHGHRGQGLVYSKYTRAEREASSCKYAEFLQHMTSRLTFIEPLIHEHLSL